MVHDWISLPQTAHEENLLTHWGSTYSNEYPFEYFHEPSPTLTVNEDVNGNTPEVIQYGCRMRHLRYLRIKYNFDLLYPVMSNACEAQGEESEIFYTHGDHLGSANWITDFHETPIQYLHYLPYGQLLANQRATGSTYNERYKFTGKERDGETGYDYFGARYFWSALGHWLSVDPLADKYPGISPYAYAAWNPVKYVDPDGKRVGMNGEYTNEDGTKSVATFYYDEVDGVRGFYHNGQRLDTEYANKATEAIGKIQDGGKYGKMLVDAVVKDDRTINLYPTIDFEKNQSLCGIGKLQWMANDYSSRDVSIPSFITLSHEFAHFISAWYGLADYDIWFLRGKNIITNDEKWAVNVENLIRNENHLEPRQYYDMPRYSGGPGMGKIPQWDWIKDILEAVCKF